MAAKRAVRQFWVSEDPWPVVDQWANHQGYEQVEQGAAGRLYRKGSGFFAGSRRVHIKVDGNHVRLEAWVHGALPVRLMTLFILPSSITIESGGAVAVLPRKLGRGEVNPLLDTFGEAPFQ